MNNNTDITSLVKNLSSYYCQFLETDFKKGREPKRKFLYRDRADRKIGVRASRYPKFLTLLNKKINQKMAANFMVTQKQYKSNLSPVLKEAISGAIETIDLTPLGADFNKLYEEICEQLSKQNFDIENILEQTTDSTKNIIDARIVSHVLDVVAPILEKQSTASIALDQLISYSEEISTILTSNAEESFPTALGDLGFRKNGDSLKNIFSELQDPASCKKTLNNYFSEFITADIFTEFRELISTHKLSENTQFYLNIGEVKNSKSVFPIYCLPLKITLKEGKVLISFDPILYANKKAIDFIVGQISKEQAIKGTNPLTDRIFHKPDDLTYVELINKTFHEILIALQVEGQVLFTESSKMSAKGATGIVVTNELSISLADKSDESIVNDYEALMTGLEGGDQLLSVFTNIFDNFLTSNPISIENNIDNKWTNTDVTEKLVFQSPLPLAEEQRKILSAIRNKDSKFISVEGPPGTGKSHTIAAIAFEMILKGKNILILSDKKEALNVVENKINEVLEKVRGKEETFVNPILRLGKTGSNYANIIKSNSIRKLKVAQQTFNGHKQDFVNEFKNVNNQLRKDIKGSISAGLNIEIPEIASFYAKETKFIEDYPDIQDFLYRNVNYLEVLHKMQELVQENRESFSKLFTNEELTKLSLYINLAPIINAAPDSTIELLRKYPKIDIEKSGHISEIVKSLEDAKGIFGYLFARSRLSKLSNKLREITGTYISKPQNMLSELTQLSVLKDDLFSMLEQYGKSKSNVATLKEFLISELKLKKPQRDIITKYLGLDKELFVKAKMPHSINDLLQVESRLINILKDFNDLKLVEKKIKDCFNKIPDFDYLKNKTYFESLNTQLLVSNVDERVVEFATNKKTDAKALEKIIKTKGKFPTDKFDILKEAFPCIIAGLRDFAEFIPLEADLFDLVIIDEASQVSIAQALPAILRAKKMIVMGDKKQYSNVKTTNASKQLNRAYFDNVRKEFEQGFAEGKIDLLTKFDTFNVTNSVMDFFEMVSNFSIQLRKHFRGYPEMISFSSKYFYDEDLQVLKIRGKPIEEVLEFIEVDDFDRLETIKNTNMQEVEKIIDELTKLILLENPPSVAVITPFSAQQKLISNEISGNENADIFEKKLKLAVFTFDTCQGEERDIIMYSMVANRQADSLNYVFPLEIRGKTEDEIDGKIKFQRLNVGFSRGKEKLVFILSKPLEEFKGSIRQTMRHYKRVFDSAKDAPKADDVDDSSPMEKRLLEWIKSTGFYSSFLSVIEIIPQFPIGQYLKSIDPGYSHPLYKVDFLIRININSEIYQFIIEYDGFDHHFINNDEVNPLNWKAYLTPGDVERECILESYGYKMIRVNRFNLGVDPVSTLNKRLNNLVAEYTDLKVPRKSLTSLQNQTNENINGLQNKTHKECSRCSQIKSMQSFYDAGLKSQYGLICRTCKGPGYSSRRARYRAYYGNRSSQIRTQ